MTKIISILFLIALSLAVYMYMTVFTYTGKALYVIIIYFLVIAWYIVYKVRQ